MALDQQKQNPKQNPKPNPKTINEVILADQERQQKITKKALSDVENAITGGILGGKLLKTDSQNYKMRIDHIKNLLKKPILNEAKRWEEKRIEIESRSQDARQALQELTKETASIEQNILTDAEIIKAYVETMTRESEGKRITAKTLVKMEKAINSRAQRIVEILSDHDKNKDYIQALSFATNLNIEMDNGKSVNPVTANREKVFKDLSDRLNKNPGTSSEKRLLVWTVTNLMPQKEKLAFMKHYIESEIAENQNIDETRLLDFLEEGNYYGTISPREMQGIIEQYKVDQNSASFQRFQSKNEKGIYAKYWDFQNNCVKEAKEMLYKAYGGENLAGQKITIKNLGSLVGKLLLGAQIAGNLLAGVVTGDILRNPQRFAETIFSPHTIGAGAGIAAIEMLESPHKIESYAEKPDQQQKKYWQAQLNNVLNLKPGRDNFFKQNNYAGAKTMEDFILHLTRKNKTKKDKLPESELTAANFLAWLQIRIGETTDNKERDRLTQTLKTASKMDLNDREMFIYGRSFAALRIGGTNIAKLYQNATSIDQKTA